MANRAYLRIWTREFSRETMIAQFVRFLATVPLSAARNSFDNLVIQAIDPTETPVSEWDFRERTFRQWMSVEANKREYAAKTRENIQQLFGWIESIERALPVERNELWSEGEENFEARLDAILGQR